jgi:CRP/FNR family cyclic AMP-dependent transcriptional regulator
VSRFGAVEEGATADFLSRIDPDAAAELTALGRRRAFARGVPLFLEGDDAHDVFVLVAGHVKIVLTSAAGREVVLAVMGAGDLLGELSAIDGEPRSAAAVALDPVTVSVIRLDDFRAFLDRTPGVSAELLRVVVGRLRGASRRQLEFGSIDALGRVCARLLEMGARTESSASADAQPLAVSQADIAAWCGLSREAVVKAMRALRTLGWIETRGRTVIVLDAFALRARTLAAPFD